MSELTQKELNNAQKLSIVGAGGFSIWFLTCTPQPLYNVFIANYLTGSQVALGILVSALHLASVFQILATLVAHTGVSQKWLWFITGFIQRSLTFSLAIVAFLARDSEIRDELYAALLVALTLGAIVAQLGAPCWWAWIARIIPGKIQGSFFAKRAYFSAVVNALWFLSASFIIDAAEGPAVYTVYGILFLIASVMGIFELILYIFIPEKRAEKTESTNPLHNILSPLRDRNYMRFLLSIALIMIALNIVSPFIGPYLTAADQMNIPKRWIGIQFGVRQILWIAVMPLWGVCMDRFGKKPVVIAGTLFFLSIIIYLFLSPTNYPFILIASGIVAGLFGPALLESLGPFMISVSIPSKRLEYASLFWTFFGVSTALGSFAGGFLFDIFETVYLNVFGLVLHGFSLLILCALACFLLAIAVLFSVKDQRSKSVGYLFSRISNPGVFRTYMSMSIIRRSSSSQKVAKTLRGLDNAQTSELAFDDAIDHLDDPDPSVREEVIRMLGRNRVRDAVPLLLEKARNKESSMRVESIKALGIIGDSSACADLERFAATGESSGLRIAALQALASIGCNDALDSVLHVLKDTSNVRIATAAALTGTKLKSHVAATRLVTLLMEKSYVPHINEIGTALGELIGHHKRFYRLLAGSASQRANRVDELFASTRRTLALRIRRQRAAKTRDLQSIPAYSRSIVHIRAKIDTLCYEDALKHACLLFDDCRHLDSSAARSDTPMENHAEFMQWLVDYAKQASATNAQTLLVLTLLIVHFLELYRKTRPATR